MSENEKYTRGTELSPEELEKITGGIYHNVLPPCPNCGSSGDPILSKKTFTFICPGCGIPRGSTGPDVQVVY